MSNPHSEEVAPRVLERAEHPLSRRMISANALKVLYRLHHSGYVAFLVGGGVRDLLLGNRPKDFDVATNARPEEVRRLFRNSRIIGRRFRLVHVRFHDEVVEVSTFRASPEPPEVPDAWEEEQPGEEEAAPAPRGDEEAYGSPAEDARRRDFTVNALFYDIATFAVIDHVGGIADLEARVLRTIGPADQRFAEDPVRMLRALEYSARLGFELEPEAAAGLRRQRGLIREAAPARLTYELLEGLRTGRAADIVSLWRTYGLWQEAFPSLPSSPAVEAVLAEVDRRVAAGEALGEAVLVGGLLLPTFHALLETIAGDGGRLSNPDLIERLRDLLGPVATSTHLANHTTHLLHHGLFNLSRLRRPPERGRQVVKLTRQESFPVTWDLARLSAAVGLLPAESFRAWSRAVGQVEAQGGEAEPEVVVDPVARTRRRRRRRGRRRR